MAAWAANHMRAALSTDSPLYPWPNGPKPFTVNAQEPPYMDTTME